MKYTKLFDPRQVEQFQLETSDNCGDLRSGAVYVYNDEIILAVNVALATGRPLLIRGKSGWGKSSLARNIALVRGSRYYEKVISSRTQARDLLYEVDLLHRLQDAQLKRLKPDLRPYIVPGVLWRAFDPKGALAFSQNGTRPSKRSKGDPECKEAVVLLDEIDKADPDLPNNLLVALGSLQFEVEEIAQTVKAQTAPLVVITTNDERSLPNAFLRRCVELKIKIPGAEKIADTLTRVGQAHCKDYGPLAARLANWVAEKMCEDDVPSPAEYLDALQACIKLNVDPSSAEWQATSRIVLWKHDRTSLS